MSRLIDRPIRPLFVDGYKNETQLIATVLSHDLENDPDIVAMIASSAALTLSGIPFMGPIGAARVGVLNGEFVLNPTLEQQKQSDLDLVVAGTRDAVLMVESEARELSEDTMLGAVMFGHKSFQPVLDAIIRLAERAARSPRELVADDTGDILANVRGSAGEGLRGAYRIAKKEERHLKIDEIKESVLSSLAPEGSEVDPQKVAGAFKNVEKEIVRGNIIETGTRIDGRGLADIRPIVCEVGVLPRTHGSSLFTRGETQALVVTTLGTGDDEQYVDSLEGTYKESFLLHYNFPPYSVGETGRGLHRPARGRPWQACLARHPSDAADPRTSSPTPSASSRRSPSPTARPPWRRCAAPRCH